MATLQNMAASFHKAVVQETARQEKAEPGELVLVITLMLPRFNGQLAGNCLSSSHELAGLLTQMRMPSCRSNICEVVCRVFNQSSTVKRAFRRLSCGGTACIRRKTLHWFQSTFVFPLRALFRKVCAH